MSSTAQTLSVAQWSLEHRLAGAIEHSAVYMPAETWQQIKLLLSPESLAILAASTAAWAVSQFFGVGEVADVVILAAGGAMLGASAIQVGKELMDFALGANSAKTESDLNEAGQHFARAVVLGGIAVISTLLFKTKPKVFHEPVFGKPVPRPTGPGPHNGKFSYQPKTELGSIPQHKGSFTRGVTGKYGDIVIEQTLSAAEKLETLYHEQVHQFLTPKLYFLRNIRVQVALDGYNRSYFLRYLEEALAQSVAELRTKGVKGLPEGISFPVKNGYVTIAKMGKEAAGILLGPINVAGNTYRAFLSSGKKNEH